MERVAILAHDRFPDRAKTAVGLLRYADHEVVAVLDRLHAGDRVTDHVPGVADAPVVGDLAAALSVADGDLDALVVGVAPIGGGFDPDWRPDVRRALRAGVDVVAGLHDFLADDAEFARLAREGGAELRDLRRPPADLELATGRAREVDADVVLTVGTDCSVGKMTTTMELAGGLRAAGEDAAVVPTGQTGVAIAGWGTVVDAVPADFVAGAVEAMVERAADDHDLLVVEGQGAVGHPAYSAVTCGILHGAAPDALVACHEAGREVVHGYEGYDLAPVAETARLYERLAAPVAPTEVVAGALNTADHEERAARAAVAAFADALDAPATDPVRFEVDPLVGAVREALA
jgi:uncharacterized NAD-dependent epimerase/dehydratase family protein